MVQNVAAQRKETHVKYQSSNIIFTVEQLSARLEFSANCVCETQMPLIMANSEDGQDHTDNDFDTSRKNLSKEMVMFDTGALIYLLSY